MAASTITRVTWTDDDGSGTTGTIINNARKNTDFYDKIDEMFAGAGSYATFTFGGDIAVEGGNITVTVGTGGSNFRSSGDTGWVDYCGGSAAAQANGAFIRAIGVGHAGTGLLQLFPGNDGEVYLYRRDGNIALQVEGAAGQIIMPYGPLFIGDNANALMTFGITVNQGAADNEILAFKSSDVAHGVTTVTETDTFASFTKRAAAGGLLVNAINSGGNTALLVQAVNGSADTARSTSATGTFQINSALKSGTGQVSVGANGNLFAVVDHANTRFLIDAEGDVHYDATTGANAWDEHDDVELLEAFRVTVGRPNFRHAFSGDVARHAQVLHETGVITLNPDGHHFVSMKGLNGLIIDAIRQENHRRRTETAELRAQLAALTARLEAPAAPRLEGGL